MTYFREILDGVSETIMIPPELRHRRIEIIILPLDDVSDNGNGKAAVVDANGWPLGFLNRLLGRCYTQ